MTEKLEEKNADSSSPLDRLVMPKFRWNMWPAPTPLHTVECDMILPFGRIYCCKLNGADFLPPIMSGYKQRTQKDVEQEMWTKFLRFIGAA